MKRTVLSAALATLFVSSLISPAASAARERVTYALEGEGRGLEIAIGGQGVTLGLAMARADSSPRAIGVGAGQCAVLSNNEDPDDLPCNESTTEKSSTEGDEGDPGQSCASPALPEQLKTVLTVDAACGSSVSNLLNGTLPVTANSGKVAEVGVGLDLSGLIPQAEDAKEQLIDQIQKIIDQAPEEVRNALDQLLDSLDEGQAVQVVAGPASSDVSVDGPTLRVKSSASGATIGVIGIPDLDADGVPVPGSSNAIEDGLIIIEVSEATASAELQKVDAASSSAATAAIVTVKVRDITKAKPTYTEISVAPGQSITILEGTPAESTISAASAATKDKKGSAVAAADAVRVHLLKGIQGGVNLGLGRATAAVNGEVAPAKPKAAPRVLPRTGGTNLVWLAVGLFALAGAVVLVRRRFNH